MSLSTFRFSILFACTIATFAVCGRAPGLSAPRTREIEAAIQTDGKSGQKKKAAFSWRNTGAA